MSNKSLKERFFDKINKVSTGCWEWKAWCFENGYGGFNVNGKTTKAHRYSYSLHFGPIPKGMLVCHKCDNPGCVNPSHLLLGTAKDNAQDRNAKNRQHRPVGELNSSAKITESIVKNIISDRSLYNLTHQQLADIYNLSRRHVGNILSKKKWKHVC